MKKLILLFLALSFLHKGNALNVYLYSPAQNQTITKGTTIQFKLGADDPYGLNFSEWYIGSSFKANHSMSGYYDEDTYTYTFNSVGDYVVYGYVYDSSYNSDFVYWSVKVEPPPIGNVNLTSPTGGENWYNGTSHDIKWSYNGNISAVDLQYTVDNGNNWNLIASPNLNSWNYTWNVPNNVNSNNCKVKIIGYYNNQIDYEISNNFFIGPQPGDVNLTSPTGGENWYNGTSHDITWSYNGNISAVDLQYTVDNGNNWTYIASPNHNSGNYTWNVPNNVNSNNCKVKIIGYYNNQMEDYEISNNFFIGPQPIGNVNLTSFNNNQTYETGTSKYITWNHNGNISNLDIQYTTDDGNNWNYIASPSVDSGQYLWDLPMNINSSNCKVKIIGYYDSLQTYDISNNFSIDDFSISTIQFANMTWNVKSGNGGPGPNNWSNSSNSVWVDSNGDLHLKIRKMGNQWYCSEIYTQKSFDYGIYRFKVSSNIENYDPNIVVGLFTYLNDTNEIDIEFSKWGNVSQNQLGWYVVQPGNISGNKNNFALNLNGSYTTHQFTWMPDSINFESWHGHGNQPNSNTLIKEWTYNGNNIPSNSTEKVHLNFWLNNGQALNNGTEAELIIHDVNIIDEFYTTFDIKDNASGNFHPGNIKLEVFDNPNNWNLILSDTTNAGNPLSFNCPAGIHPIQIINLNTPQNEFWGSHNISVPDSSNMTINREAPYEVGTHRPYITQNHAQSQSTDPAHYYTNTHLAAAGQKVYIPVKVKNDSYIKDIRASVFINESKSYNSTALAAKVASINGNGQTHTFIFEYVVPDTLNDSTKLSVDVKVEAEYNNEFVLVDSYNGWEEFTVTTALPSIDYVFPSDNSSNIPVNSKVEVYFNNDMDSSTVVDYNNCLLENSTKSVNFDSIVYNPKYKQAIFYPTDSLNYNTSYTFTLKADIKNLSGINLDGNYTFSFTTNNSNQNNIKLRVPYYYQDGTSWCAFTSASMLLKFYNINKKPWEIAGHFNKNENSGLVSGVESLFNTNTNNLKNYIESQHGCSGCWKTKSFYSNSNFKQKIIHVLNSGNPVWVGSLDAGHAVLVTGYDGINDSDSVFVHDPSGAFSLNIDSNNLGCINFGSSWNDFINWLDCSPLSIFGDVKIIYYDYHSSNSFTNSIVTSENGVEGLKFKNSYNGVQKSLILKWNGEINNDGYYYDEESNTGWYPNDNILNTQLSATQADELIIHPHFFRTNFSNHTTDTVFMTVKILDNSNNVLKSFDTKDFLVHNYNPPYTKYNYNAIKGGYLSGYNQGQYKLKIITKDKNGNIEDQNEFKFSIASSSYASVDLQHMGNKYLQIIKGDTGVWNIQIINNGTKADSFLLRNYSMNYTDTCQFSKNNNLITETQSLSTDSSKTYEMKLNTWNMQIGRKDTILLKVISKKDPNVFYEDTLIYEIIDCTNPVANFDVSQDVCVGDTLNIVNQSTNTHTSTKYHWDIKNNGNIDYKRTKKSNISHVFTSLGSHQIKLIVHHNNIGCSDTIVKTVNVHEVTANAGNDIEICKGESISLKATGGKTYQWSDNIQQGTSFIPNVSKTYNVTVTDNYGCIGCDSVYVMVNPKPSITSSPSVNNCNCDSSNGSITGISTSGSNFNYEWTDIQGNIIGTNADINNIEAGIYEVKITSDKGCFIKKQYTVNNIGAPSSPNVVGSSSYCEGDSILPLSVNNSVGNIKWYSDNNLDSSIATGDTLILSPQPKTDTSFFVTEMGSSCESAPTKIDLIINPLPNIVFDNLPDVCVWDSVLYLNHAKPKGGTYSGNGVVDNKFLISNSGIGSHSIAYNYTDTNGCSKTDTQIIKVYPDTISPTAKTKDDTVYLNNDGYAILEVDSIDDGSWDNVGIDTMFLNRDTAFCSDIDTIQVILTVEDYASNEATDTTTVTVKDTISPTVNTQDDTVYLDNTGSVNITPNDIDDSSTDNCSIDTMTLDKTSFNCSDTGNHTVTMTVTDSSGNSSIDSATVTVEDNMSPTVNTQNITVYLDGSGSASITANDIDDSSTDNCSIDTMTLDITSFTCSDIGSNTVTLTVKDVNG
ncbi:MAG: Ig-like domain-containing protein, partial [archaeon]